MKNRFKHILRGILIACLLMSVVVFYENDLFCYSDAAIDYVWETHPEVFDRFTTQEEIDGFKQGKNLLFFDPSTTPFEVDPYFEEAERIVSGKSLPKSATSTQSVSKPKAETPKCEHEYVSEITTPATCKDKGEITYTCSKCGDTYTEAIDVDTNAHQYSDSVVETEPTCVEDGLEVATCSVCGDRVEKPISSLGHDYTYVVTAEPTCTEKGVLTYTCSRCTDSYTEDLNALGHTESELIVDKEANWFFNGSQHKECTVCGEILITEAILSKFPTWYLYVGIGVLVLLITTIIVIVAKKKRQ